MKFPKATSDYLYWKIKKWRGQSDIKKKLLFLLESQYYTPSQIKDIQFRKLNDIIKHAYDTVPYYNRIMNEYGMTPGKITCFEDLSKLPVLSRTILRENQDTLISSKADFKTLTDNFSSGSTGIRACFKQDANYRGWMRAHQLRTYGWCADWCLGEPFMLLWGSEIYWKQVSYISRLENFVSNRREYNTFKLSNDLIQQFLKNIIAYKPKLISTYTNAMYLIALQAEKHKIKFPYVKAIQGTSEPLPPSIRDRLRNIFDCEIYNKYGSRETNVVSHESPNHEDMCIQEENVYVEFLNNHGNACNWNEKGTIVVTTLNNFSMPLIRYETSDIAAPVAGYCSSGIGLSRMTSVAGRLQDLILTPNGDHIDAYFFSYLFMRFTEIHWFQVVQQELKKLLIRIYAPYGFSAKTKDLATERIHHHTGFKFEIDFEILSEMPDSPTGKFRLCISEIMNKTFD